MPVYESYHINIFDFLAQGVRSGAVQKWISTDHPNP